MPLPLPLVLKLFVLLKAILDLLMKKAFDFALKIAGSLVFNRFVLFVCWKSGVNWFVDKKAFDLDLGWRPLGQVVDEAFALRLCHKSESCHFERRMRRNLICLVPRRIRFLFVPHRNDKFWELWHSLLIINRTISKRLKTWIYIKDWKW